MRSTFSPNWFGPSHNIAVDIRGRCARCARSHSWSWFPSWIQYHSSSLIWVIHRPSATIDRRFQRHRPGSLVVCHCHRRLQSLRLRKTKVARAAFEHMTQLWILRRSEENVWISHLQLALKPNGNWRLCGDIPARNAITTPERYQLAHNQDWPLFSIANLSFPQLSWWKPIIKFQGSYQNNVWSTWIPPYADWTTI